MAAGRTWSSQADDRPRPEPCPLRQGTDFPIEHEGKKMFLLRDLEGLDSASIALSPGAMMLASLLDGKRGPAAVRAMFAQYTGTMLAETEIVKMVEDLAKAGMLETEETARKRQKVLDDFRAAPSRKAAHAGTVFPQAPLELSATLGKYFRDPKGPGKSPGAGSSPAPLGLIAPHIDFQRGGPAYAWAYQALSESAPPDLIVGLGVAHMSPNSPWILTKKAYETPYGPVACDPGLFAHAKGSLWYDPLDDEWAHRTEHSLEFQAVWLKFLWKEKSPAWLPILCSSFERFCPDRPPSTVATIDEGLRKLGERLLREKRAGKRILILAGIDLAHVGPRFGDDKVLGPELFAQIEAEDRKSLDLAMALKADEFYLSVVEGGHWRKVCGLSALYTALRLMEILRDGEKTSGKLLAYGQAPDPQGGVVSFASGDFIYARAHYRLRPITGSPPTPIPESFPEIFSIIYIVQKM